MSSSEENNRPLFRVRFEVFPSRYAQDMSTTKLVRASSHDKAAWLAVECVSDELHENGRSGFVVEIKDVSIVTTEEEAESEEVYGYDH